MSLRIKNFIVFGLLTALVLGLYFLAVHFGFFYIFWWYDNMMHLLAGVAMGFLGLGLFGRSLIKTGFLAGLIGILYEIFERLGSVWWPDWIGYGATGDTILDVVCGILGALIIIIWQKNNTTRT